MIPNNNLSILPFYGEIGEQDYKKFQSFGDVYPLICERSKILPFQIRRETRANQISIAKLINFKTGVSVSVIPEMNAAGLVVKRFESDGYDLIVNPSALIFPSLIMEAGQYYLEVGDGVQNWFSEVFTVVNDVSQFLKLVYSDSENIYYNDGHLDYGAPFKNYLYIRTEIGKPEYPFEEEAEKRDGYTFIEKQISEKKYKFEFLAPEYLCDALRIVRMHDFIDIYNKGKRYNVHNIIFDPKWKDQGNLAVMEVEFECDTVIKKIGRGAALSNNGDFNSDFNNDFNN